MDEKKAQPKKVSTCFEGSLLAERMQKIMDEEGLGSLCDEMTRSLVTKCGGDKEEPQGAEKKEGHGSE